MALKSMTGFGEGAAAAAGIRVVVELSSVNRKQLDIHVSLPRNLVTLDAQVQRLIRSEFSRGRVSGIVRMDAAEGFAGSVLASFTVKRENQNLNHQTAFSI